MSDATARLNALLWARRASPLRPGYWLARRRLGPDKYGPLCPAAIILMHTRAEPDAPENRMERSPFLAGFFAGDPISPWSLQAAAHTAGDKIIRLERSISEAEYRFRVADGEWAKRYAPHEPIASPHKAIDLLQAPLPF